MEWITEIIRKLMQKKHYGKLTISFENGRIVHVDKQEGMKPPKS